MTLYISQQKYRPFGNEQRRVIGLVSHAEDLWKADSRWRPEHIGVHPWMLHIALNVGFKLNRFTVLETHSEKDPLKSMEFNYPEVARRQSLSRGSNDLFL